MLRSVLDKFWDNAIWQKLTDFSPFNNYFCYFSQQGESKLVP